MKTDFIDIADHDAASLRAILNDAKSRKDARKGLPKGVPDADKPLEGRILAMIFDKQSTRTRISFDVGMRQLGGTTIMLTGSQMQLAREETIADTARVLSRYVDVVMIRLLDHEMVMDLAANCTAPVINGLTKLSHPCQVMADILTFEEKFGSIQGRTVAWSGDANNVCTSWIHAAAKLDFTLRVAAPPELQSRPALRDWVHKVGAKVEFGSDAEAAVEGADCVVSDAWVSMGDEDSTKRHNLLKPFQVNSKLMARANKDALFMHCLPAHRGEEVTDDVIDGPQSAVWDEAENRLHVQKSIMAWTLGAI
ncbi:ornithine carbamoyltransferase [Rhizomicrobium palustre]|uniref:Ornithine carbamoyltransferase n=1 Tax=Rhizomicrobium palustre TaxID=189966 RepID=A0A846N0L2_9PROT|nr:ornithine carbamoyltransferase [Rhizomicrobium palustre]NIK89025.1 ornithine carbamoyltransferase [Rhizomicrobium palustre]